MASRQGAKVEPPSKRVELLEDALVANPSATAVARLSLKDARLPPRPGYAKNGSKITLRTNYFEIQPEKDLQLTRYRVEVMDQDGKKIDSAGGNRSRLQRAFKMLLKSSRLLAGVPVATDYCSILVALKKLSIPEGEGAIELITFPDGAATGQGSARGYRYRIAFERSIYVQELMDYLNSADASTILDDRDPIIQTLNVIMGRVASGNDDVALASSNTKFFPVRAVVKDLGQGLGKRYYSPASCYMLILHPYSCNPWLLL
jgi:hypothetical protein